MAEVEDIHLRITKIELEKIVKEKMDKIREVKEENREMKKRLIS